MRLLCYVYSRKMCQYNEMMFRRDAFQARMNNINGYSLRIIYNTSEIRSNGVQWIRAPMMKNAARPLLPSKRVR